MHQEPNEIEDLFYRLVVDELSEVRHPYSALAPTYKFSDPSATTRLLLNVLRADIGDPEYQALGELILESCRDYYQSSIREINQRTIALQVLTTKFEPFVKKIALILGHPAGTVDSTSAWRLLGPAALGLIDQNLPALVAFEDTENIAYWVNQPAGESVIYRTRMSRNSLSHTAFKLSSRDLDQLFFDVIGAFLYVTDKLEALQSTLTLSGLAEAEIPFPALRTYCEHILQRFHSSELEYGYIELDFAETDAPGSALRFTDLISTMVSRVTTSHNTIPPDEEGYHDEIEDDPLRTATEVINSEPRLLLCGSPGAGKTTVVRFSVIRDAKRLLNQGNGIIPVYVELSLYRDSLEHLIDTALSEMSNAIRTLITNHSDTAFYFDGLNEVDPQRLANCVKDIRSFLDKNREQRVIITTRPNTFYDYFDLPAFLIEELTDVRIAEYAAKYMEDQPQDFISQLTPAYRELARTPLLLMLLTRIYKEEGLLPSNRSLLYDQFVKWLHQREHLKDPRYNPRLAQDILEYVAFRMQSERKVSGYVYEFNNWLEDSSTVIPSEHPVSSMLDWLIRTGWFLDIATGLRFHHQTFQEFLASEYLAHNPHELTENILSNDNWQEVLLFLAGLAIQNHSLITKLRSTNVAPKVIAATVAMEPTAMSVYEEMAIELSLDKRIEFMQELRGNTDINLRGLIEKTIKDMKGLQAWLRKSTIQSVGTLLRYRDRVEEWEPIIDYLENEEDPEARRMAAMIAGIGHAPFLRQLMVGGIDAFIGVLQSWRAGQSSNLRLALNAFIGSNGLERLMEEEKTRVRILCLELLTRSFRSHGIRSSETVKLRVFAIRILGEIGEKSDLELAVKAIPINKNSPAAQSIRTLVKHKPYGLQGVLEHILQTQTRYAVTFAAVQGLITLIGDEAEPAIQDFITRNPTTNRRIVRAAKGPYLIE